MKKYLFLLALVFLLIIMPSCCFALTDAEIQEISTLYFNGIMPTGELLSSMQSFDNYLIGSYEWTSTLYFIIGYNDGQLYQDLSCLMFANCSEWWNLHIELPNVSDWGSEHVYSWQEYYHPQLYGYWANVVFLKSNKTIRNYIDPSLVFFPSTPLSSTTYNVVHAMEIVKQVHYGKTGVNEYTGNYSTTEVDLKINLTNIDFEVARTYNSLKENIDIVGKGWSFGFKSKIYNKDEMKVVELPNGSIYTYIITMAPDLTYTANNSRTRLVGTDTGYILTTKENVKYIFNENYLVGIQDKYGNMVDITIDSDGQITGISDYRGLEYVLGYEYDKIKTITDPLGNVVEYTYDALQRLTEVSLPNGSKKTYSYNNQGLLINKKELDSNENIVSNEDITYEEDGKISVYADINGNEKVYVYDTDGRITEITDINGDTVVKYFDEDGYLIKTEEANGLTTEIEYFLLELTNKYGEESKFKNIYSNTTLYVRDANGNILTTTTPNETTLQSTYNSKNNITKTVDELGNITEYIYDSDEVTLLKVVKPINGTTVYSPTANQSNYQIISYEYYDQIEVGGIKGLLKKEIDPLGNIVEYTYDQYGNISSIKDEEENITTYVRNVLGWILEETSPEGRVTEYEYDEIGNVIRIIQEDTVIRKEYDEYSNLIKEISPNEYDVDLDTDTIYNADVGTRYTYDQAGNMISKKDSLGNITEYEYDEYGRLIKETKQNGLIYIYEYDVIGRRIKTSYKLNSTSTEETLEEKTYAIDDGYLTIITKTYKNDTQYITTSKRYDKQNRLVEETNGEGQTKIYMYLANGLLDIEIDEDGKLTKNIYNKLNQLERKYDKVDASSYICTRYEYDAVGRLIKTRIGTTYAGSTTVLPSAYQEYITEYYMNGQVYKEYSNTLQVVEYAYDGDGNKVTEIDANGNETTYEYDDLNRLIEVTNELGQTTTYTYDKNGNMLTETNKFGNTKEYEYDVLNRLIKVTNEVDIVIEELEYNNMGWQITEAMVGPDAEGDYQVITYTYDEFGNMIEKEDALGNTETYTYNLLKNVTGYEDKNGNETIYTYDNKNRLTETIVGVSVYDDPLTTIQYIYEDESKIARQKILGEEITQNQLITYAYDIGGRLIRIKDQLNLNEVYIYNPNGTTKIKTTRNGDTITYTYDVHGRLTSEVTNGKTISYVYDNNSNITQITNANMTTNRTYDALNRELTKVENGITITHVYDIEGTNGESKETITNSETNETVTKTYDKTGRLILVENNGETTTYTYNDDGSLQKTILPNDEETEYEYNERKEISKLTNKDENGSIKSEYEYEYDNNGNIISKTETIYDGIDAQTETTTYTYDAQNRIKTITQNVPTGNMNFVENEQFITSEETENIENEGTEQEEVENIEEEDEGETEEIIIDNVDTIEDIDSLTSNLAQDIPEETEILNSEETDYTDDIMENGEIEEIYTTPEIQTTYTYNSQTITYTYDTFGNRIKEEITEEDGTVNQTTLYEYNNKNQLTTQTVQKPNQSDVVTTYTYDNNSNQLTEKVGSTTTQTNTYSEYNELLTVVTGGQTYTYKYNGEGKRIQKKQGTNTTKYMYDGIKIVLELNASNNVKAENVYGLKQISRDTSNQTGYYIFNGHGDVVEITDEDGDTLNTYKYNEFGQIEEETGTFNNPFKYAGEYYDLSSGYYYLRARDYDSSVGRFIQEDPIKAGYNWYVYCRNNPLIYVDPLGLVEVGLRDYTGTYGGATVSWNASTQIATVHYEGKQLYVKGTAENTRNGRIYIDDSEFINTFGVGNEKLVVYQNGNNVSTRVNFNISGKGAGNVIEGGTDTYKQIFMSGIENVWSGNFGEYNVSTHVGENSKGISVKLKDKFGISKAWPPLFGWSKSNHGGITMYVGDSRNKEYGAYLASDYQWVAAHEFGHILGVGDAYNSKNNKNVKSIYNVFGTEVQSEDIEMVLKAWNTGKFQNWK